jgi:hypothetical protein
MAKRVGFCRNFGVSLYHVGQKFVKVYQAGCRDDDGRAFQTVRLDDAQESPGGFSFKKNNFPNHSFVSIVRTLARPRGFFFKKTIPQITRLVSIVRATCPKFFGHYGVSGDGKAVVCSCGNSHDIA